MTQITPVQRPELNERIQNLLRLDMPTDNPQVIVVKYGGHVMTDPSLSHDFALGVRYLVNLGHKVAVVHGGGPQISAALDKAKIKSEFKSGFRVTTKEVAEVVKDVLCYQIQPTLTNLMHSVGVYAIGVNGDEGLLFAEKRNTDIKGENVDLGFVGNVTHVESGIIDQIWDKHFVPIISTVGKDSAGNIYNVNADVAAKDIAVSLEADQLLLLTDVEGLYADWPHAKNVIRVCSIEQARRLLPDLDSGMAPKIESAIKAVEQGVRSVKTIDGRVKHSIVISQLPDIPFGTTIGVTR